MALLLANKAGVNTKDNAGWAPLHGAAYQGVAELLRQHGAEAASLSPRFASRATELDPLTLYRLGEHYKLSTGGACIKSGFVPLALAAVRRCSSLR